MIPQSHERTNNAALSSGHVLRLSKSPSCHQWLANGLKSSHNIAEAIFKKNPPRWTYEIET